MRDEKFIQPIVKFNKQQNEKQKQTINMYCVCPKHFFYLFTFNWNAQTQKFKVKSMNELFNLYCNLLYLFPKYSNTTIVCAKSISSWSNFSTHRGF